MTRNRDHSWLPAANAAMNRLAAGDDQAFNEVYQALAPRIRAFLVRRTPDEACSEDLLQQTFLKLYAARRSFTPGADVLPWAFAISRRLLIDDIRHRRTARAAIDSKCEPDEVPPCRWTALHIDPEETLARCELRTLFDREVARLPEPHRRAFELVKREERSIAEAAEILATTGAAVKLRAFRACVAIRTALADAA